MKYTIRFRISNNTLNQVCQDYIIFSTIVLVIDRCEKTGKYNIECTLHGRTKNKKGQKMAKNEFPNVPDKELVTNNRYVLRNVI